MGGPRRYIPATKTKHLGVHLTCDGCATELRGAIEAYDSEDYRDEVLDLAGLMGWTLNIFNVFCRDCTFDRAQTQGVHDG